MICIGIPNQQSTSRKRLDLDLLALESNHMKLLGKSDEIFTNRLKRLERKISDNLLTIILSQRAIS